MNRPSRIDFNIGTRGGVAIAAVLSVIAIYGWATPQENHEAVPWIFPVLTLLLCKASVAAKKRVDAFNAWNGAWNEMAGEAPPPQAAKRKGPKRAVLGILAWLLTLSWLSIHSAESGTPAYGLFSASFLGLSVWGAGATLLPIGRWIFRPRAPARPKPEREHVVAACLPVPRNSPPLREITAALPEYCRTLLAASRRDASPQ